MTQQMPQMTEFNGSEQTLDTAVSSVDVGYYSRSESKVSHSSMMADNDSTLEEAVADGIDRCSLNDSTNNNNREKDEQGGLTAADADADDSDIVSPSDSLWTCKRDQSVRLRTMTETEPEPALTVMTAFRRTVKRSGEHPALVAKVNGSWKTWTFNQYYDDVRTAAKAFIKVGLEPYHGVGIIGFNSPEWFIADVGAVFAGGLATGIYTTNTPEACHFVASNAKCNVIVVENENQLRKIQQVWDRLPDLKAVVQYTGQPSTFGQTRLPVYSWEDFMKLAESVPDATLEERIKRQAANQCCSLIYTSGTTGNPKGVMLSHDNFIWTATKTIKEVKLTYAAETLISYLPLSHVAAQVLDIYIPMVFAVTVYFAQPDALKGSLNETMREVRPTVFFGVPRVWEKIQEKMTAVSAGQGYVKQAIMSWARGVGLRGNLSLMNGGSVPFGWTMASALVFRKVRQALGLDQCRLCVTSAAPITRDTLEFFTSLDIPLMELFGMSESTGPVTISTPNHYRITSTGTKMSGVALDLLNPDKDGVGEVCMNGRNIFMGYLDEEAKTREALDDTHGLRSGDLGKVDDNGFLFITGRIKELLITAGGENVAPVPIEDAVKEALPIVSNCMLIGDKCKFLSILLTLKTDVDKDTLEPLDKLTAASVDWLQKATTLTCLTVDDVRKACAGETTTPTGSGSSVASAIQAGIDRANRSAPSRAQNIQKWTILPRDFSIAGGELGPTLKLRRPIVLKMYEKTINSMYVEA